FPRDWSSDVCSSDLVWYEPSRPLNAPAGGVSGGHRESAVLKIEDVLGNHGVETRLMGRVTVREENALAALEVMSRFAVDPRWLVYLPPTMAPAETSSLPGYLDHPPYALAAFRVKVEHVVHRMDNQTRALATAGL